MPQRPQMRTGSVPGVKLPDPLAPLRELPDFAVARSLAIAPPPAGVAEDSPGQHGARGKDPARVTHPRVNTHVHLPPNFSAFETVEKAVDLAADAKLQVLGSSNYDDFGIYARFARSARSCGVFPLFGLEIISLVAGAERGGNQGKRSRQSRTHVPVRKGHHSLCSNVR